MRPRGVALVAMSVAVTVLCMRGGRARKRYSLASTLLIRQLRNPASAATTTLPMMMLVSAPQPCLATAQDALDLMHYGQRSVFADTTVTFVMIYVLYCLYSEVFKFLASR